MTRFFDVFFSFFGVLLLTPVMIIIIVIGYFDTGSPLFVQTRVGRNMKPFNLIKFRTMLLETKSVATHLVAGNAVTKTGAFLRKTKLDELPQLLNVIKGEMSLVGPRPCLYNQLELIEEREQRGVFNVLPGITGLAQINKVDMSTPEALAKVDQQMNETMSVVNYFKYIVLTVLGKGAGDCIH